MTKRVVIFRGALMALLLAGLVLQLFWAYVPLNMDEFVSYQLLAYLCHPFSNENISCFTSASFYLRVLGKFNLPLLSYDYIGSLSSFLYAPFFFVWQSPMSARITGVIALFVQALVLSRMFRFNVAAVFCCFLLFLPYCFVHIADTGPVAFQTTSVFLVYYLLRRWILSRRRGWRALMVTAAGLVIALACWVKPTYFFVSLGLAATALFGYLRAISRRHGDRLFRTAEYLLLTGCAAVPTLLIYEARRIDGRPYLPVLTTHFLSSQIFLMGLIQRFKENVFHFLLNPLDATSFYFDVRPALPILGIVTCLLGGGLLLSGIFLRNNHRYRTEILQNCVLFILALLLIATNIYAKSMHNVVLAYPFVFLAAARSVQLQWHRIVIRAALVLFIILNGSLYIYFPSMLRESRQSGSFKPYVEQLNDDLNKNNASDSVIVCADWGIYFVKALYGPRSQIILSLCPTEDWTQLQRAAAFAQRLHRNLTIVGLRNNQLIKDRLSAMFPEIAERVGPGDGSPWRIWRVSCDKLGTSY